MLVNTALIAIKLRGDVAPEGIFMVPLIIPVIGLLTSLAMLVGPILAAG